MKFTRNLAKMIIGEISGTTTGTVYVGAYRIGALQLRQYAVKLDINMDEETRAYPTLEAALAGETPDTDGFVVLNIEAKEIVDVVDRDGKSTLTFKELRCVIGIPLYMFEGHFVIREGKGQLYVNPRARTPEFQYNVFGTHEDARVQAAIMTDDSHLYQYGPFSVHEITEELCGEFPRQSAA